MQKINKTILKEYKAMALQSFSDGQIEVEFPDENNLTAVQVVLKPNDGLYKDGKFEFDVTLPEDYPNSAPSVTCRTKIFHPNINYSGTICFNILSDEWDSDLRLVDYVHSLLWLLYQPNLNSRLNGDCPQDEQEFASLVRKSIIGGHVAGQQFPCALANPPEPEEPASPVAPAQVVVEPEEPARPAAPALLVHEVETRSVNDLRAFFNNLINANQTIQPLRTVERTPAQPQPQPEQPEQPREVPQEQPVATTTTTTTTTPVPTRYRTSNLPPQMRWAQFILPSIQRQEEHQQQQRSRSNNSLRNSQSKRWAPVSPPIRFVGSMRVY